MSTDPKVAMTIADAQIAWALEHPGMSSWLKRALREAMESDPVAVANDVEVLRHLVQARCQAWVDTQLEVVHDREPLIVDRAA